MAKLAAEGAAALAALHQPSGVQSVGAGQFSGVQPDQPQASIPVKISPAQLDTLKGNTDFKGLGEKGQKQAIIASPIPPGVDPKGFASGAEKAIQAAVASTVGAAKLQEVIAEPKRADPPTAKVAAPLAGFLNESTGEDAPRAGGFIDLASGRYVPPPAGSSFDSNTGVFVPPRALGSVDPATGLASATKPFTGPDSFAKILPYEEYLPEAGIFVLKDGSLGAIYDIGLVEHEPVEAARIVELVSSMKAWFFLPERCTLQVFFDQSEIPARDPICNSEASGFKNAHPVAESIYKARLSRFQSFCEGKSKLSPMRRRALLSIRYFPDQNDSKAILRLLERGEGLLFDSMNAITKEVAELSQILAQFQESSRIPLTRLSGAVLVYFLRRFFNTKEYLAR